MFGLFRSRVSNRRTAGARPRPTAVLGLEAMEAREVPSAARVLAVLPTESVSTSLHDRAAAVGVADVNDRVAAVTIQDANERVAADGIIVLSGRVPLRAS